MPDITTMPDDELLRTLRDLESRIYALSAEEVVNYTKLKLEAIRRKLVKNEDEELIKANERIVAAIAPDNIQLLEQERAAIRSVLFNKQRKVTISQKGSAFHVKETERNNTCHIIIPTHWKIKLEQSFLLSQIKEAIFPPTNLEEYVLLMLKTLKDVALVAQALRLYELAGNDIQLTNTNGQFDKYMHKVIEVLANAVKEGRVELDEVKAFIAHRRRIMNELVRLCHQDQNETPHTPEN